MSSAFLTEDLPIAIQVPNHCQRHAFVGVRFFFASEWKDSILSCCCLTIIMDIHHIEHNIPCLYIPNWASLLGQ